MPANPLSIQLYTLRDLTAVDFPNVLRQVKEIGYGAVEVAGYGSLKSATALRAACDDAGLVVSGIHQGLDGMEKNPRRAIDDALTLGTKNLIIPWVDEARRGTPDAVAALMKSLDRLGGESRKAGLTFGYHNHDFEFKRIDGKRDLWDFMLELTSPQNMRFELDVYWSQHAGINPLESIKRLSSRLEILHLKDMAAGEEKRFAPCGTGIIDLKGLHAAARAAGVTWYVVEQDRTYDLPPLEAVRTSFNNLKKLGIA